MDGRRLALCSGLLTVMLLASLVAGCSNPQSGAAVAPGGGPGAPGMGGPGGAGGPGGSGGPGGPGGRGRRGGRGRGGPLAANASPAEIYQQKCQFCHGDKGQGARGPALAGAAGDSDAELIKVVTNGSGNMPSFKDQLSEAQIKAVVGHVKQLASAK